jgi:hypothetical protein
MKSIFGLTGAALAAVLGIIAAMIVGLVIASMAVFGYGIFVDHTADRSGRTQVKKDTIGNGSYRIAQYDAFYDECATIQTDEQTIHNITTALTTTTDQNYKITLNASLLANENKRAADINSYNGDARKADTKGHFRSSDLPYQIDPNQESTSCTAS